jgi:acyl-CoA reductase-like NAD-dependent aldehyde dehydrogenase
LGGAWIPHRDEPIRGIKDSGLGYKEGAWEAMKSYTNIKTYSLPWPA